MTKLNEEMRIALCEAMMHLEVVCDPGEVISIKEADLRTWAAHQLIQQVVNGHKGSDFDEVLSAVRMIDTLRDHMTKNWNY